MSIPLRLYFAVALLMCSVWGHSQERKAESPTEKARRSESLQKKRAVDEMVKREGISQVEAERKIEQVEKAFKPGLEPPLKKPNSDTGSFLVHNSSEKGKQKTKITLKDLKPDRQPENGVVRRVAPSGRVAKTKASTSRPQENDRPPGHHASELGSSSEDKPSKNTHSGERTEESHHHEHHADLGCDDPQKSQSEREVCKKREKSRD